VPSACSGHFFNIIICCLQITLLAGTRIIHIQRNVESFPCIYPANSIYTRPSPSIWERFSYYRTLMLLWILKVCHWIHFISQLSVFLTSVIMKVTVSRRLCCVSLVQTGLTFQRCLWPPSVWWCIYRIRTAITMSKKNYHYILSWATSHTGSLRSLLISSLHLLLGASHFFFPWSFHKNSPLKQSFPDTLWQFPESVSRFMPLYVRCCHS
jgi:hypothetical protein